MTTEELSELIQNDIICYIDDILDDDEVSDICDIVANRINEYERANNLY